MNINGIYFSVQRNCLLSLLSQQSSTSEFIVDRDWAGQRNTVTPGICPGSRSCFLQRNGDLLLEWLLTTFLLTLHTADGCRHWERHSGAMEIQAQWAAKLLQEYQRRAEASGFPGPHTGVSQPSKESPVKTVRGTRNLSRVVIGHLSGSAKTSIKLKRLFFLDCLLFRWPVQSQVELCRAGGTQELRASPCRIIVEKAAIQLHGHQDGWRGHPPGKI